MRENERVRREAAVVIQRKDTETLALKNHAEVALNNANHDNQAIQQRKIDLEVADNRKKDVLESMKRDWVRSSEDMRLQLQAEFQKQNEATVALVQSQALPEMQKREADLMEQQKVNQGLMNRQIFDLQTQLQDGKAKANMPAPLQLGPSLSAQNAMVEEALKTMKEVHQKAIADMNSSMDIRFLQAKVSADKEHRNEMHRKQDEIDQMNSQNEKLSAMIGKVKAKQRVKDEAKSKQKSTRSSSETPKSKTEYFPLDADEATIEEEEEPAEDQENQGEDDDNWDENDDWNDDGTQYPNPPGWAWNPETKAWDQTQTGSYQDLDDEERFQFARQSEANTVEFDDWPGPGRDLMYTINIKETVQLASITPEKASIWMGAAEVL